MTPHLAGLLDTRQPRPTPSRRPTELALREGARGDALREGHRWGGGAGGAGPAPLSGITRLGAQPPARLADPIGAGAVAGALAVRATDRATPQEALDLHAGLASSAAAWGAETLGLPLRGEAEGAPVADDAAVLSRRAALVGEGVAGVALDLADPVSTAEEGASEREEPR